MPKRIHTPPPADDEPRYLTVVHPYAISGTCNMELPKDRQDFARWVACCIDKDAFFAIFHKPSSRGMVIIEIRRDYPHLDRILGEHRWSEFLQSPTKEEKARVTQVFHCTYNTGRIVQKNGWKRIDVDEAWFKAWSLKNRHISFPYPATHFCDLPVEDRTNHPLCRPLPGVVKTPPVQVIAAPQPVVGSPAWIQTKEDGPSSDTITTQGKSPALGAWGNGAPKAQAASAKPNPTANGSVKKTTSIPQTHHTGARLPAVGGGPIIVKTNNVWRNTGTKASPATNWDDSPPVSRQSTPVSRGIPSGSAHQAPTVPPGLAPRKNAWEDGASQPTHPPGLAQSGLDRAAANFSATGWDSASASASSPDSDLGPDLTTATESDNPYNFHIHQFTESMEEEFHGMGIRATEDDGELRELDSIAPGVWEEPTGNTTWETRADATWGDDALDAEDHWRQDQQSATKPMLCNAHGLICKKGICQEYAKQVRLAKRAKEAEERRAASANKGKKGGRAKGRAAGKKKDDEDEEQSADKNTTRNNAFRGPGAPVKTNWRGRPRAIVSVDTIEKRETTKPASDDGWGNSDPEVEPNAATVVSADAPDATSNASWNISEDAYDPWATNAKAPLSWADQVEATSAKGGGFTTAPSKRNRKRGTSTATSTAKSSTSGWGSVPDMPW